MITSKPAGRTLNRENVITEIIAQLTDAITTELHIRATKLTLQIIRLFENSKMFFGLSPGKQLHCLATTCLIIY